MSCFMRQRMRKGWVNMIENDTIKLLRECDAGVKMGVTSINDSVKYVKDSGFREILQKNVDEHEKIKSELQELLDKYHDRTV